MAYSQSDCTAPDPSDSSKIYDLNPLAASVDYIAINTRYPTYSFNINVCKPIVYTDNICTAGTGICERSSFSSTKIGMASTSFVVVSRGVLEMSYPGGSGCFNAVIRFTCKEGAGIGAPVYISENCVYTFSWETEYACSKTLVDPPADDCIFSSGSFLFDLNPISNSDYAVQNPSDAYYTFKLNPCKPLTSLPVGDTICPAGSLACQTSKSTGTPAYLVAKTIMSATYNSETSILTLLQTEGDYCPNHQKYRQANYQFTCGTTLGTPVYVSENACTFNFAWSSSAACPISVEPTSPSDLSCEFSLGGKQYDLTPLDETWSLFGFSSYIYYLNPCNRINLTSPDACSGTQSCQVPSFDPSVGTSIGKVLTAIFPGLGSPSSVLVFRLTGGDYCPEFEIYRTTEISFGCGDDLGYPQFESEHMCYYRFKWLTSLVCQNERQ